MCFQVEFKQSADGLTYLNIALLEWLQKQSGGQAYTVYVIDEVPCGDRHLFDDHTPLLSASSPKSPSRRLIIRFIIRHSLLPARHFSWREPPTTLRPSDLSGELFDGLT